MRMRGVVVAGLALAWAAGPAAHAQAPAPVPAVSDFAPRTLDDWRADSPEFAGSRRVARGERVRGLPMADKPLEVSWKWKGRTWTVDDFIAAYRVSGLMVLKDGQVVLERYGLGRQPMDRWASMSVAKSVTSLLAGAAIQDGKLRLEDPIVRFVPELTGSAYDGVTVRQMLTMSSGVRWNEDYTDPHADIAQYYALGRTGDAMVGYLKGLPRVHPPGAVWHYNTAEANLAGLVISRAVGEPLADYLSRKIWKPYGMERDAFWAIDRQGREIAGCCLSMTLADYARLGQFALDNGVIDGAAVLPPDWMAQSTRVQIANGHPAPGGYGYFWWIGRQAYEASGIYGQSILVYPRDRLVIVVNSAWPRPVGDDLFGALSMLQGAIHDAAAPDSPREMRDGR